jgi:paraquat-inducible protein A
MSPTLRLDLARGFVIAGAILYLPANILPVMTMIVAGDVEHLTVLGGVEELYDSGLWPVAALVFLASITVPFLKLLSLAWILLLHGSQTCRPHRTKLHRFLHQIGTWSMIDIFLLAILAAVGQLGVLASVEAEPGGFFFAAMLLCTIFATDLYKTEMIWSPETPQQGRAE